jgi:hypothetical protein
MTLGEEFRELADELLTEPGGFGSLLRWRHYDRASNPATGEVTQTSASEVTFTGAITTPVEVKKLLSDATLQRTQAAVVIPATQVATAPAALDEIEVSPGRWLRIIETAELFGPGESGSPVLVAYVAALES